MVLWRECRAWTTWDPVFTPFMTLDMSLPLSALMYNGTPLPQPPCGGGVRLRKTTAWKHFLFRSHLPLSVLLSTPLNHPPPPSPKVLYTLTCESIYLSLQFRYGFHTQLWRDSSKSGCLEENPFSEINAFIADSKACQRHQ